MFERNRVDSTVQQAIPVAAEVACDGGVTLKGRFLIPGGRSLADVLNGAGQFMEFEPHGEPRRFIAKTVMREVKVVSVPNASQLETRKRDMESFDPHTILGVARGADWDTVRGAYHQMSKIYHPDRYSAVELPTEVREYLAAMAARVNAAYAALERNVVADKARAAMRSEPIYTSCPRA